MRAGDGTGYQGPIGVDSGTETTLEAPRPDRLTRWAVEGYRASGALLRAASDVEAEGGDAVKAEAYRLAAAYLERVASRGEGGL